MTSKTNELDTESLLVLYIAGELTNGAKAALERRLTAEPLLAAQLRELREAQVACADALGEADAQIRMPVNESVAVRRVSRAMAQWQVDRVRMVGTNGSNKWHIAWWAYPAAVAAMLIIGFLIWSSRQPIGLPGQELARNTTTDESADPQEALADWMDTSFGVPDTNSESALSIPAPLPASEDAASAPLFPTSPEETLQ